MLRDVHLIDPLAVLSLDVILLFLLDDHIADDCNIFPAVLSLLSLPSDFSILIFFFLGEHMGDLLNAKDTCFFSC